MTLVFADVNPQQKSGTLSDKQSSCGERVLVQNEPVFRDFIEDGQITYIGIELSDVIGERTPGFVRLMRMDLNVLFRPNGG